MKNIETLMKKATELKAEGLVEGQISEELRRRAHRPDPRISLWIGP
jgi:orotate phosphoribosyltransferase-like protein